MKIITYAFAALGASFLTAHGQAPSITTIIPSAPVPPPSSEVGVSSRDGITLSGAEVLVTRNGLTEKLTTELELSNGLRVQPDGTVITREGGKVTLRTTQVLTFDGRFLNAPIVESVAPTNTTTTTTTTVPAAPATTTITTVPATPTIVVEKPAMTKQAADEAARVEAERRANALNKGPIKAGEGVQK